MSRVFTIVVILALMAVIALVPRIGTEVPGLDLGDGYAYREDTLARFWLLLEDEAWILADPPGNPQGMMEAVHEPTGLTFVLIPAGRFETVVDSEDPAFKYTSAMSAFLLCTTECTQAAWGKGGGKKASEFIGADRPVERVPWRECYDWTVRNALRLPDTIQWEYACRAGTRTQFWWGSDWAPSRCMAENDEGSGRNRGVDYYRRRGLPVGATAPVGQFPANPWGLHDMLGNVGEWIGSPAGETGWEFGLRDVQGGSWKASAERCRFIPGLCAKETARWNFLGFRPAKELPVLEGRDGD